MEPIRSFLIERVITYPAFAAIGLVAAFAAALLLCFYLRQNWVRQIPMMLLALFGLAAGAKLFGMLSHATYLHTMGAKITVKRLFLDSGIVFYGGLLGYLGALTPLFGKLLPKKRLGWDIVAVTTPLFHGFARIGCYFAREEIDGVFVRQPCCYGIHMDNAFCAHFWDSRLPVQLIEAAFNFLLFGTLLALLLSNKKEERRGNLLGLYLLAYAVFRFGIEYFRADELRGGFGALSFSQVVSLFILFFVALYLILRQKGVVKPRPIDPYDPEVDAFDLFQKPVEAPALEQLTLSDLQPSQFYVSEKKLQNVLSWFDPNDLSNFEPIPVKLLDNRPVMLDGHTRAVAALTAGLDRVPLVWEPGEWDWEMYRRCVRECRLRDVCSPKDLVLRVIPEQAYWEKWDAWCDRMQAEVEAERND